jgi:hypothetical protein
MINNLLNTLAKADKTSVDALRKAVQNGTVPAYIGVPMIAEKVKEAKKRQAGGGGGKKPPVAQQVMQEVDQLEAAAQQPQIPPEMLAQMQGQQPQQAPQGIDMAQSNLPPQGMAGGGIVAFANRGLVDGEEDDSDDPEEEEYNDQIRQQANTAKMIEEQAGLEAMISDMADNPEQYGQGIRAGKEGYGINPEAKGGSGLLDKILHLESRGRDYDKEGNVLTSPKGAKGKMQTMDATVRDPGFGVMPARDNSLEERNRVGRDYIYALKDYYKGNEKYAAIAYNMGPGATDKWLMAGADVNKLPAETRKYQSHFATGGEVKHFVNTGLVTDDFGNLIEETNKKPLSKEASEYLRRQAAKNAGSAAAGAPSAFSGINKLIGRFLVPGAVYEGGKALGDASMKTMAGNPYFDEYSDPFMGDVAVGNQILKQNPGALYEARNSVPATAPQGTGPLGLTQGESVVSAPAPQAKPSADKNIVPSQDQTTLQKSTEDDYFSKMLKAQEMREAGLKSEKTFDNYMALLQAGLGMMAGTSPWTGANIGQGGSAGIAYLANARKAQGQNERALARNQMDLLAAQELAKNRQFGNKLAEQRLGISAREADTREGMLRNTIENQLRDDYQKAKDSLTKEFQFNLIKYNTLKQKAMSGELSDKERVSYESLDKAYKDIDARARQQVYGGGGNNNYAGYSAKPLGT